MASQEYYTNERWVEVCAVAAGKPCEITYVPLELIRRRGASFANYRPPLTWHTPHCWDLAKAERDFGFRTTPLEEWMPGAVAWYRERPELKDKGYAHRDEEVALARAWKEARARQVRDF